ncbi:MAG: hypothetical protein WA317_00625 [Mycobacterium sp.]|uniref:hypothetical protein n=1 Tax=Mycobacterium sp. TaxID=1785 RepID=UPI003CC632BC
MSDNHPLSAKRPQQPRDDEDVVMAVSRLVRAVGRRCAAGDPDSGVWLRMLRQELAEAESEAVAGWRDSGFSDSQIGRELGVTKQAVQKRWPREGAHGASGPITPAGD